MSKLATPGASYVTARVTLSSRGLYFGRHRVSWGDPLAAVLHQGLNRRVTVALRGSPSPTPSRPAHQGRGGPRPPSLVLAAVVGTTTMNLGMHADSRRDARVIQVVPRDMLVDVTATALDRGGRRW